MSVEVVGPSIGNLIDSAREKNAPEWWVSELASHEQAHADVYRRSPENQGDPGDFAIMYAAAFVREAPEVINDTYTGMRKLLVYVVLGAAFLPKHPLEALSPKLRMEIAEAPGYANMSGERGDWGVWKKAKGELHREKWLEAIQEKVEQGEMRAKPSEAKDSASDQEEPEGETDKKQDFSPGSSGVIKPPPSSSQEDYQSLPLVKSDLTLAA